MDTLFLSQVENPHMYRMTLVLVLPLCLKLGTNLGNMEKISRPEFVPAKNVANLRTFMSKYDEIKSSSRQYG
jgi:hypothetical protein